MFFCLKFGIHLVVSESFVFCFRLCFVVVFDFHWFWIRKGDFRCFSVWIEAGVDAMHVPFEHASVDVIVSGLIADLVPVIVIPFKVIAEILE